MISSSINTPQLNIDARFKGIKIKLDMKITLLKNLYSLFLCETAFVPSKKYNVTAECFNRLQLQ